MGSRGSFDQTLTMPCACVPIRCELKGGESNTKENRITRVMERSPGWCFEDRLISLVNRERHGGRRTGWGGGVDGGREEKEWRASKGSNGRLHGEAVVVMVTHRARVSGSRNVHAVCTYTHTLVIIFSPSVLCVRDDRWDLLSESPKGVNVYTSGGKQRGVCFQCVQGWEGGIECLLLNLFLPSFGNTGP